MSHWRRYTNKSLVNVRKEILEKAAKDLGLEYDSTIKCISNAYGNDTVIGAFIKNGKCISLGIQEVINKITGDREAIVRGDFWATGIEESTFTDRLSQAYTKYDIIDKVETQTAYSVDYDSFVITQDGAVEFEVYAYN